MKFRTLRFSTEQDLAELEDGVQVFSPKAFANIASRLPAEWDSWNPQQQDDFLKKIVKSGSANAATNLP